MAFRAFNRISWFLLLIAALLLLSPVLAASAQQDVVLETLRVEIWPEYDQPSVLVMYTMTLSSSVTLPAEMGIRIPASAGKPHAVAMQDANGLYNLNYEMVAAGEWVEIRFTAPVPQVRLEYYDPSLQKEGQARSYVYRWPGDYTVNNLSLQVQQPFNATQMTTLPDLGNGSQGNDGLTYYSLVAGKVNAGTPFEVSVGYQKPDDRTSVDEFQAVQPNQPITTDTTGRVTPNQLIPWVIGVLGVLLIATGGLWYWRTGQARSAPQEGRRRHARTRSSSSARPIAPAEKGGEAVFCSQCGKKSGPGDVFCRACGSRLR